RVLHAIAELAEHDVRQVERVLSDEEDADPLRADQPYHLFDLLEQRLRRIAEQEMRLIEEEHELRLVEVANLRQVLEQLRQQPQQEGGVNARTLHEPVGSEDVDRAVASGIDHHEVGQLERRLAEEPITALLFQLQQSALNRTDTCAADIAVDRRQLLCVVSDKSKHRPQVFEVEQQQTFVIRDFEDQRKHAGLDLVEIEKAREQQRADIGDRGAHRMTLRTEQVPEDRRIAP